MKPGPVSLVVLAAAVLGIASLALAGRDLDEPGLYYDEVIQAQPALDFLREDGGPPRIPGARATRVLGRWLPWMTQPYMGALKSQLLIPVFAVAAPGVELLRGTTLLWALLGVPLVMLFANRALGLGVALVAGALLALDPSLLFLARHDWGSFSLGFLLRSAALLLVYAGWRSGSPRALAAGGACLGLGLYNKIDFGVFLAAAAASLLLTAPGEVRRAVTVLRGRTAALAAGFAVGVAPLALAAGAALSVAGAAAGTGAGVGTEKLAVLGAVLDGSYFQRLILAGGRFERLADVAGATGGIGSLLFVACAFAMLAVLANRRLRGEGDRACLFVLATAVLTLGGILVTPRALRAHHFLNATPFPQLVIAAAVVLLWTRAARIDRVSGRGLAVLVTGAALVSALRVDLATLETLRETGGRGRWSHAVERLAGELPSQARVVSLDWGFDGPLRFVSPGIHAVEPFWRMQRQRGPIPLGGTPDHVYLVNEPEYAVFPFGRALSEAIARLPEGAVHVELHRDREGAPVFRAVRFATAHSLVYRAGAFEVRLR